MRASTKLMGEAQIFMIPLRNQLLTLCYTH